MNGSKCHWFTFISSYFLPFPWPEIGQQTSKFVYISNTVEQMEFSPNILKKFHMFLTSNWYRAIVNVFVGHVSLILRSLGWHSRHTPRSSRLTSLSVCTAPLNRERESSCLSSLTHTLCSQYFPHTYSLQWLGHTSLYPVCRMWHNWYSLQSHVTIESLIQIWILF